MSADIFKTNIAECYVENGILIITFVVEELTLDLIKAHTLAVKAHYANILPMPTVVDNGKVKVASKEVRTYAADEGAQGVTTASGIIISSLIAKVMINLFLTFSKPKFPAKAFPNKAAAIEWLNQYKMTS